MTTETGLTASAATNAADVDYAPGSLVKARGREWVVLPESERDMLVLRPLGGTADEITAIFPLLEPVGGASFPLPSPEDLGDAQAAGLLRTALRIGFASSAGPFRSMGSIAVEPRSYQLVPLLMAMRQDIVRLAICDDVGIGKTIESGLIAKELLAQGSASGLAVLCSPALAEQWQDELRTKFGIDAELILSSTVPRLERSLDWGKTLFEKHQVVVVSTDFIKSPRHRHDFIDHCPDLVIVDEAHTCVPSDGGVGPSGTGSTQQQRYDLLTRIAADKQRHLILATATPHSGKDESFRSLLGLLDPELETLDLGTDAGRATLSRHYVQRRRYDIRRLYPDESTAFAKDRLFSDAPYKLSPAYRDLLDDAIDYASQRVTTASGERERRVAWWSAIALLRSLVSSPRAAAQTLKTRAQTAAATTAAEADVLGSPIVADMADDSPDGIDASPGADESGASGDGATIPMDSRLAGLAERAAGLEGPERDKKLALLVKTVKSLLDEGCNPIVFCRYIPTSEYVAEHLTGKLGKKTVVAFVNGTLSPAQRLDRIDELSRAGDDADGDGSGNGVQRVLVATDCLSEGVNLQHGFDAVIHYDLAWNPTRHEQREGRVDRFGQEADDVKVVTIYGSDNGIDGKVLEVLIRKHREIRKSTGISVPIPDETSSKVTNAIVEWLLLRGREQQTLFSLDDVTPEDAGEEFDLTWTSMLERESRARTRFAQGAIHSEEAASEAAAIRDALGPDGEVRAFTRAALVGLGASVVSDRDGGFSVPSDTLPAGLRETVFALIGERKRIPFRTSPAVPRGEASLTRTDPVIAAVASHVLSAALDAQFGGPRPARRCGVIRTAVVAEQTTALLVRYRYQLNLPGRYGNVPLIAEDARVLAFTGAASPDASWLPDADATALLDARPDANTDVGFAKRTVKRVLPGLDTAVLAHLRDRGDEFADELRTAHRRVRQATDTAVRGLTVTLAGDPDILGVYTYLPVSAEGTGH